MKGADRDGRREIREAAGGVPVPAGAVPVPAGAGSLREIVMGAQDNLTNVLAVVLGVSVGSGEVRTVALAGLAAGVAEAISMAGVLYTTTKAERDLDAGGPLKEPLVAAAVTFGAAIVAAIIPLAPFAFAPFRWAMAVSTVVSVLALFALGAWTGGITRRSRWRAGMRFVLIGGLAAIGSALVGAALRTDGV